MRLTERLAVLIKADAHGVLDQLEEQGLLLKQVLREAELELDRKRARSSALEEEERSLREAAARLEADLAALDADVELALGSGELDLARFAVRRLLPQREALAALRERSAELGDERTRLDERLARQERELEGLRARVRARLARERWRTPGAPGPEFGVADEEVELELMRRRSAGEGER